MPPQAPIRPDVRQDRGFWKFEYARASIIMRSWSVSERGMAGRQTAMAASVAVLAMPCGTTSAMCGKDEGVGSGPNNKIAA